jgi:hypothetical protein
VRGLIARPQVVTELLLLRSRAALPINYAVVVAVTSAGAPGFRKLLLPFFLCSTAVEKTEPSRNEYASFVACRKGKIGQSG